MPIILRLLLTVCFLMILFGFIIHFIEPEHFPSAFDGIWWAFVTGSTVGYGDYVPLSTIGKVVAILLILAGGGLVTFYMATLSAGTIKYEKDLSEGKIAFKGSDHLILIGWNERTRQLLKMFESNDIPNLPTDIVLIDHSLNRVSYQENHVHFIHGQPTSDDILEKANIQQAKCVVITSDPDKSEEEADRQTILNIIAAKGNNVNVYTIAEILTDVQKKNATRAGSDEIIKSNQFMSSLFFQSLFQTNSLSTIDIIAKSLEMQQFCSAPIDPPFIQKDFYTCALHFLEQEQFLIGIIRDDEYLLHPSFTTILQKGDQLIYLKRIKRDFHQ